ncbi:MAG: M23 family metallopeptidase [Hyphomonadaceae bacterium]
MRQVAFNMAAMLALAGCAVTNTPYPRPALPGPSYAPPAPNIYTSAPRAPLHSQLFACASRGSNLGEIGYDGDVVQYAPYIDTPAGALLRLPVEAACLSSGFGWRGSLEAGRQHNGVDLANPNGGFVFAAGDGWVRSADVRGGYGNVVEIDHGDGVHTLYAHLAEIDPNLHPGSFVAAGAAIGRMGMTGNATGVHLHYEVTVDGLLVDPLYYGRPPVFVSAPAPDDASIDR